MAHPTSADDPNVGALRLLGAKSGRPTALSVRAAIRRGLPFAAFESLSRNAELTPHQLTAVLGIPSRTFARRKASKHLTPEESDRLYRVARAFAMAAQVLGDMPKARSWLVAPNRALGGDSPLEILDTDIGARQVEDVLQRLNYGVFS